MQKHNLMNDKRIRSAFGRYSCGGYIATEVLCSVSHCCDNVARQLNPDIDTGCSTDEYELEDVDDNTQSLTTASSNKKYHSYSHCSRAAR